MVKLGVGRHIFCLAVDRISAAIEWSIYAQIVNIIGIGLVKISVCLCVLRVIDKVGKMLSKFLWVIMAFVSLSHLAQVRRIQSSPSIEDAKIQKVILFLVQCRPMAAIWDAEVKGECFSSHVTYLAGYIGFGKLSPGLYKSHTKVR